MGGLIVRSSPSDLYSFHVAVEELCPAPVHGLRYNDRNIAKRALVECVFDHAKGVTTAVDSFPGTRAADLCGNMNGQGQMGEDRVSPTKKRVPRFAWMVAIADQEPKAVRY